MGAAPEARGFEWRFRTATARRRPSSPDSASTERSRQWCSTVRSTFALSANAGIPREGGDWFEAYVAQVLLPTLRPGDVGIMDNLSSHKRASVREMIEAKGARLRFLPPYSPHINPIKMAFSKLKVLVRKAAERTVAGLRAAIGRFVDIFTPL
jgi:transposase